MGPPERRTNAPAPPLGAVHHRAAGQHRPGRHRFADQEKVAGIRHVWRRGRRLGGGRTGSATYLIAACAVFTGARPPFHLKNPMKLATWNINPLPVRLPQVLDWLQANPVDVLALQELKLTDDKFPLDAFAAAGYQAQCFGQKTYNGVALLTRTPVERVVKNIPGFDDD